LFLFAQPLIGILFGRDFQPSIPILKVLSFAFVPYTVNSFLSLMFLAKKKENVALRVTAISLFILLTLNLFLVPRAGPMGAGWAVLLTETIQALLFIFEWIIHSSREKEIIRSQGVMHELSNLP
jgi:O-antigen/teichoic acid export membrane protein